MIPPIVDPQKPEDDFVSQHKPSPLATASGRSRLSSMDQQLRDSNGHDSQPTEAPLDLSSKQQSESPVSSLKSSVEGPLAAGTIKCIRTLSGLSIIIRRLRVFVVRLFFLKRKTSP